MSCYIIVYVHTSTDTYKGCLQPDAHWQLLGALTEGTADEGEWAVKDS